MPRGNDHEGNVSWNEQTRDQYGIYANADEMIQAHRASVDHGLLKTLLVREDTDASDEARGDLTASAEKLEGILPDEVLIDVAVHGNALVGVVEAPDGTVRKVYGPWNEKWTPPRLSPQQVAEQKDAEHHKLFRQEIERLRQEHAAALDELRADNDAALAEAIDQLKNAHKIPEVPADTGIDADDDDDTDDEGGDTDNAGESESEETTETTDDTTEDDDATGGDSEETPAETLNASTGARTLAAAENVDLSKVTGTGKDGKITQPDVAKFLSEQKGS